MRLRSLNTGLPREVDWHGRRVTTGIYKAPVAERLTMRTLNLDGDRQADLTVHGGRNKAVYCYPFEHYAYWSRELPGHDLPLAVFGENFTTEGLTEDDVHLGDELAIGTARAVVTQPRMPCYKLGIRFGSEDMVRRFLASRRSGFYLAVLREGEVGAGDAITIAARHPEAVSISDILRLYLAETFDDEETALARRALRVEALPEGWKDDLRERLDG